MKRLFFTVTGTKHYYGQEFIEPKMVEDFFCRA